jgi:hypothetical protein
LYIRLSVFRRLFADDALVCAAWLMTLANAIIWQRASSNMYLTLLVGASVLDYFPSDVLARMGAFLRAVFASYLLFYSTLWSIKLSFLIFFRKLGQKVRRQEDPLVERARVHCRVVLRLHRRSRFQVHAE